MRFWVYIDEAGDRGSGSRSSEHFLVAAVIVRESNLERTRQDLTDLASVLGRGPGHPIHFRNLNHSRRIKAAADLAMLPIDAIAMAILCKRHFLQVDTSYLSLPDPMYFFAVGLALERASWYLREQGATEARVNIAHIRRLDVIKLSDHRRTIESASPATHWRPFEGHPFEVGTPTGEQLLQVSDIAASSAFQAIEPDPYGNTERRYLDSFRPKLYRCGPRSVVTKRGLRVYPRQQAEENGYLSWLRRY
jgi:hypothetical protein